MKRLLSKTTKPFITYVLIILVISIPSYYWVVDTIWKSELDEHNKAIAEGAAYGFNRLKLSDAEVDKSIDLWKKIQPQINIEKISENTQKKDSYFTVEKPKLFSSEPKLDRYRCLKKVLYINNQPYLFTIQTNIEESQETIAAIAVITTFFFVMILLGLLFINRRLSVVIWKPFRNTLKKIKDFNLNQDKAICFEKTDTIEFEELHESLMRFTEHSISAYKAQKEFTENASHELQTPLAVIKNKLDILLQNKDLTEEQYSIIEDINKALSRSSRINKSLLLLAKIENKQFDNFSEIQFDLLLKQSLNFLEEHFLQKNLSVQTNIASNVSIKANMVLAEILINNLLMNSIHHTEPKGLVSIHLSEKKIQISNSGDIALNTKKLFKRFSKFSATSRSGIGLSIIDEICKSQNWKLTYRFDNNHHIFELDF